MKDASPLKFPLLQKLIKHHGILSSMYLGVVIKMAAIADYLEKETRKIKSEIDAHEYKYLQKYEIWEDDVKTKI